MIELFDIDELPAKGEHAPYLFGFADRERITDQILPQIDAIHKSAQGLVWHHFDGATAKRIDYTEAQHIAALHVNQLKTQFKEQQ